MKWNYSQIRLIYLCYVFFSSGTTLQQCKSFGEKSISKHGNFMDNSVREKKLSLLDSRQDGEYVGFVRRSIIIMLLGDFLWSVILQYIIIMSKEHSRPWKWSYTASPGNADVAKRNLRKQASSPDETHSQITLRSTPTLARRQWPTSAQRRPTAVCYHVSTKDANDSSTER